MSGVEEVWFSASESTSSGSRKNRAGNNSKNNLARRGSGNKRPSNSGHSRNNMAKPVDPHDSQEFESDDDFDKWAQQYETSGQFQQQQKKQPPTNKSTASAKDQERLSENNNHNYYSVAPSDSDSTKPGNNSSGSSSGSRSVRKSPSNQSIGSRSSNSSSKSQNKQSREFGAPELPRKSLANGSAGGATPVGGGASGGNRSSATDWNTMPAKLSPGTPLLPMESSVEDLNITGEGHPVPILIQNEETNIFELDEEALSSVLLDPCVADKHVCVLAVAGAFRKGKSFLLDFLLRFCTNRDSPDWLGDSACPLKGFKWRQGSKRETTGILVWSKPFIVKKKSGEEIAVVLMDTQGTFDTQSSMKDSTVVFALTMMVSSVLVYNLMNNIQEDDLMNLQTFTSYGIQAQEDCDTSHAFQRLQFLVRDWGFPYETPYGHMGGQGVLDEILQITPKQHPAHQDVRRDLRKCFRDINCYLMPHPGFKVIQYANFDGRLDDIEDEFLKHLRVLVPRLLAPENLVKKEFGGQPIKARDLFNFFKTFMEVFKDIDLPEPTTLVEFAARASSQAALEAGKELYTEAMDTLVGGDRPFLKTAQMEMEHEKEKLRAVASYLEKNKYGRKNQRVVEKYQTQLEEEIDKMYLKYVEQNEAKNVFKAARTPATLFCALMMFYLLSGMFGLFGIYPIASICNLFMGAFLVMLTLWAYVRYSGEYRDVGIYIDEVATFLWENFLAPVYSTYMEKPLKDAAEQAAHQAMNSAMTGAVKGSINNNQSKNNKT